MVCFAEQAVTGGLILSFVLIVLFRHLHDGVVFVFRFLFDVSSFKKCFLFILLVFILFSTHLQHENLKFETHLVSALDALAG